MGLTELGLYLAESDLRNRDGALGADSVVGLSTQKEAIPTKADLSGVRLTDYKLVPPGYFAYVPDTSRRGDMMSLAYNDTQTCWLVSSISVVFFIRDPSALLPQYLFMFFKRPEFDRYVRFHSWGSAREVFSWEEMSHITIDLPPPPVQRKYAAVYRAAVGKQQRCEQGLAHLRSAMFTEIEAVKHTAARISAGRLLEEVDVRNSDGRLTSVQGINIRKEFMPSVADTFSVDLRNYKVVRKGQFAYSAMQTGRDGCIRIALLDRDEPALISPAYAVLQVKDPSVMAEYIMAWFTRPETDRCGWFSSDASIRSSLDLNRFFNLLIPVPDRERQQAVAALYRAYAERQRIAAAWKQKTEALCPLLLRGSLLDKE